MTIKSYFLLLILIVASAGCFDTTYRDYRPVLALEESHYSFGEIPPEEKIKKKFELENRGNEKLRIKDVTTTNDFITITDFPKVVKPGRLGYIKVTIDPKGFVGEFNEIITISSNSRQSSTRYIARQDIRIHGIAKVENERKRTIAALEEADKAFDDFKEATEKLSDDITVSRKLISEKFDEIISDAETSRTSKALEISDEIDASICVIYAEKISDLQLRFNNIEESCGLYIESLNYLLFKMRESKDLHDEMKIIVDSAMTDYNKARTEASKAIEEVETKYIEMCHYKEAVIIVSTVRSLREKMDEFFTIADEAKNIINELNKFANDGKKIIAKPVSS